MDSFEQIYSEYFDLVYRYMLSLSRDPELAEEITQETFFKALQKLKTFRGQSKLSVWLCQIAKNTYLSHLEKQKRRETLDENHPTKISQLDEKLSTREDFTEIHRILHQLEDPYKEVFWMRAFGELSYREIAALYGKTESWARVTYHRARMKIKEEIS